MKYLRIKIPHRLITILLLLSYNIITVSSITAQRKNRKNEAPPAVQKIILTSEDETSRYRIVIPAAATVHESKAATVLQDYLIQISGAVLPIISSDKAISPYEIVLGQNERLDEIGVKINFNDLQQDGFTIKTDSLRLLITGGNGKGTLYGVYTFLEDYLGCRMYSPKVKAVPKQKSILLDEINDTQIPVIGFRDTHYRVAWHDEYIDWHKLSHDENGGRPDWGMWVHTFNTLVPPEIHFKDHPEYFSEVNGKRIPTQLCLTNPDVLELTIQNLRKKIAENPEATYWSVSQNDNRNYCTCDNCRAIDEREGSPSGSIINFANQVADQFPDRMISTLAYEYGRHAPKNLIPRDNVNIMLCSIEVSRDKAITEDSTSIEFMHDVQDWGKIAKDIIVWDYVIQFNNLISPFPNLHVLKPNIKFFVDNGVNAMFEQGNREVGGEFAEFRTYLISKLLWNPDADVDVLMNDFLDNYFWRGGKAIRQYINEMKAALLNSGEPLRIFGSPITASESYLTPELISRYEELFDQAELAVADSAEVLERVKIARLPLEFAIMEQAKKEYTGERGVFQKVNGQWQVRSEIKAKVDPFVDLCVRQGVTRVKEWSTSPDEYRASMYRIFSFGMNEHLAYKKKMTFNSPDSSKLPENAAFMLTDGIRGGHDYAYNWLAFSGQNLDVTIDLEEIKPVRHIESAYFQYGFWLRLFPKQVDYYVSVDGKNFEQVGSVPNTLPIDQYGGQQRDFIADFEPRDARYVKVIAQTIGNTPDWHPGAGRPANMIIDEIVVE
ncbi:MAG: DUF4838 domain-containing protein [Bacteroidetes bacterium]|nr:DUF4838 domain-containing protein [Bacteroidota bacterium]MDA1120470.1 DUF4838 domain-containing protein [Bacteroidota bacterium]